ncbi:MAG: hypothetical protein E6G92_07895 [Alphaproteobacteria bacterium]|nr:MAG: hypothetical protein E6G92_07895 [Alphaproteobacteria bacterium]
MILLDAAPLMESNAFVPDAAGSGGAPFAAGTLEAAIGRLGAAGAGAAEAERGDMLFDLFVDSRAGYRAEGAERTGEDILAATSWRGLLIHDDSGAGSHSPEGHGTKDIALRAAFDDIDGDGKEDDPIVVKGERPKTMDDDSGGDIGGGYGDGSYPGGTPGGGGGGGQSVTISQETEDAKDTPCVDEVPAGVDKEHLNDLAKHAGTVLAGLQDSTGWEWGAFIYRGSDGQLFISEAFTARHQDDLIGATVQPPAGAVIVGWIHTHPIDSGDDQRNLSVDDRDFVATLVSTGRADANMLSYVTTKDRDLGSYDNYSTYVYDKSKRNSTSPGCDL